MRTTTSANTSRRPSITAGIAKIEIERDRQARKTSHPLRKAGYGDRTQRQCEDRKASRQSCQQMLNGKPVLINIVEVKNPDANAQLVAENIAAQLEKRISFRRAMKHAIGRAMRLGVKGIKTTGFGSLWAALKSHEASSIMRAPFRFRPCVPISTTVLPRPTPPTVVSALRFGFTRVRFCTDNRKVSKKGRRQPANAIA